MDTPWTLEPQAVLEHFGVDPAVGLSTDQAVKHAELYGKNGACSKALQLSFN